TLRAVVPVLHRTRRRTRPDPMTTGHAPKPLPLLEVNDLHVAFRGFDGRHSVAVDGVGFSLARGEGLAVVGESGSGKSVTALALARLLPDPPAVVTGRVRLDGRDVLSLTGESLRAIRGRR